MKPSVEVGRINVGGTPLSIYWEILSLSLSESVFLSLSVAPPLRLSLSLFPSLQHPVCSFISPLSHMHTQHFLIFHRKVLEMFI